eukprot:TRINITY_DN30216_c0_g1_i2.p1 TRINITY_DN30216_c0_g1~~TRINITY_DN30216_c0_g1_i2.p1  ORF type:complete len:639 (-),score=158.71 TRINITY_DN30216_c0_g1_i2:603-2519(-)
MRTSIAAQGNAAEEAAATQQQQQQLPAAVHAAAYAAAATEALSKIGSFVASTLSDVTSGSALTGPVSNRRACASRGGKRRGYNKYLMCISSDEEDGEGKSQKRPVLEEAASKRQAEAAFSQEGGDSLARPRTRVLSDIGLYSLGGSPEQKLRLFMDEIFASARRLEGCEEELRASATELLPPEHQEGSLPAQVRKVIAEGTYDDHFLQHFDGRSFPIFSEELVPFHAYRLALEVHSGGAYWKDVPADGSAVQHSVETIGLSLGKDAVGANKGTCQPEFSSFLQPVSGQRGACFVWRWQQMAEADSREASKGDDEAFPKWILNILRKDGDDPLSKLQMEREAISKWEQQCQLETTQHVQKGSDVDDIFIKEVLKLWPTEIGCAVVHGRPQLKKKAWIAGLDASYFAGKRITVKNMPYDDLHSYVLRATVTLWRPQDQAEDPDPPFVLTTDWKWARSQRPGREGTEPLSARTTPRAEPRMQQQQPRRGDSAEAKPAGVPQGVPVRSLGELGVQAELVEPLAASAGAGRASATAAAEERREIARERPTAPLPQLPPGCASRDLQGFSHDATPQADMTGSTRSGSLPLASRQEDSMEDFTMRDDPARSIQRSQSGGGGLVQYAPKTTWRSAVMTPDEWPSTD